MKIKTKGKFTDVKVSKKRGAVYTVVGLMLCTAVYLNWSYTNVAGEDYLSVKNYGDTKLVDDIDGDVTSVANTGDSLESARLIRTESRDEAISILNETINNELSTETAKNDASAAVSVMSNQALTEGVVETMIKAQGFDDSVVFINTSGVNVLVTKTMSEFTAEDAATIKDIIVSETSVTADKIKIVESN